MDRHRAHHHAWQAISSGGSTTSARVGGDFGTAKAKGRLAFRALWVRLDETQKVGCAARSYGDMIGNALPVNKAIHDDLVGSTGGVVDDVQLHKVLRLGFDFGVDVTVRAHVLLEGFFRAGVHETNGVVTHDDHAQGELESDSTEDCDEGGHSVSVGTEMPK